uniref:Heparan-sulfate 6-O-sulfotransferase n=1 Tax=Eptatretus burgeri TaxID=7764 RepID=A0A8C4WZU3_EPTBU
MVERARKAVVVAAATTLVLLVTLNVSQYGCPPGRPLCRRGDAFVSPRHEVVIPTRSETAKGESRGAGAAARASRFDVRGGDVLVFLHIQKTGGTTFGRHLVRDLALEEPCRCLSGQKKCVCRRPGRRETWLFSRFSTGWSCGLHADWTELTECVPAALDRQERQPQAPRRYHYVTILREPVSRYISEWRHVQRGATWRAALHRCARRAPTPAELPPCYSSRDWTGVSLEDFMGCTSNLANNRQVRMLADLKLVGCYNTSSMHDPQRSRILLESAKLNLRQMAFFGLTEEQRHTQQLFEWTFGLRFSAPFEQHNVTHAAGIDLGTAAMARIHHLNRLDMELYNYAHNLFLQRYATMARQQVLLAQGYS